MDVDVFFTKTMPPQYQDVQAYFEQMGAPELEARHFFLLNDKRNWTNREGTPLKRWKPVAYRWISVLSNAGTTTSG